MSQLMIQEVKIFNTYINYMVPFPISYGNCIILVAIDCVSKWVDMIPFTNADVRIVIKLFKEIIFPQFSILWCVISNGGWHFIKRQFKILLKKYGISHKVAMPCHPQTLGQVKVSNCKIMLILKCTICKSWKDWSLCLNDALWTYYMTFKIPIGTTPYHLVYGKVCHLLVEL